MVLSQCRHMARRRQAVMWTELGAGAAGKMKVIGVEGSLIKTSADRFLVVFTALPQIGEGIAAGVQNGRHLARADCRVPTYIGWLKIQMEMGVSLKETRTVSFVQWLHADARLPGANWGHACLVT